VEGSDEARERLALILRTLGGELSVAAASATLGVSESHFHRLRERALAGAAEALEPRPGGRPQSVVDPADARVAELQEQLRDMELELRAAQVREQLALVMPHVLQPPASADKKKARRPRKRRGPMWGVEARRRASDP
jgi:transposase